MVKYVTKIGKIENKGRISTRRKSLSGEPTLTESIAECLRISIERGSLMGGVVLHTTELAHFFNVSRIPVVRAIEKLEDEQLLQKRDTQGYIVSGCTKETKLDTSTIFIPDHLVNRFNRQPRWERIYDQVESELLELMPYGHFQINESALTEHYGLNRGQTQQIVIRLSERGVVEKLSQSQCNLLAYDELFLRHRYELRALLEPMALQKASAYISEEEAKAALERHISVAREFPNGAEKILPKLESQLHINFIERCANPRILVALAGAQKPLIATTRMILRVLGSDVEEPLLPEHIAVLEPLAKGFPQSAASNLRAHLESSCERSISRLSDLAALPEPTLPPFLRER